MSLWQDKGYMDEKISLKGSNLPELEGTPKEREEKLKEINDLVEALKEDKKRRKSLYKRRYDFYTGNHEQYTTIHGKTTNVKTGHPSAVFNYAGKSAQKISYGLANNPPNVTIPARKVREDFLEDEQNRAQAVEEFVGEVFTRNMFWKKAYRRAVFNQVVMADAAIKCYPVQVEGDWDFKLFNHEKMENIMVAWRGDDPTEFDAVITEEKRSIQSIKNEFGIDIPEKMAIEEEKDTRDDTSGTDWAMGQMWSGKKGSGLASGETKAPSVILREYDSEDYYCLMVNNQFIEFIYKDNESYPKLKFWTFVHNIPQPRSPWSMSDIDFLTQPQIEFNEASNEERSYIRVGAVQRYVAYNMDDFNPESVTTGSGGVIFVNSQDNQSRFEPLSTNLNTFPVDSYLNRVQQTMFDLGVPKVTFGAGGADSGRSKAIDYQSLVELIDFKQDSWELALTHIINKIQYMGDFYFGNTEVDDEGNVEQGIDIFKDMETGVFVVRQPHFDWNEVMPITQADKIVNVLNKFTMGLPFRYVYQEMGYDDVEAVIDEMRREMKDPELMEARSKMYQLTQGLLGAQMRAMQLQQSMAAPPPGGGPGQPPGAPGVNTPAPTMIPAQGGEQAPQPAAQKGGTTVFSSPKGYIDRTRQNLQAAGG